jgi:hypothetical protein
MQKGDIIRGEIQGVSREVRHSKKGQPFTGLKVHGNWYQVWGDRTNLRQGQQVELEVSWVAPEGSPVFCTLNKDAPQLTDTPPAANGTGKKEEVRDLVRLQQLLSEALHITAKLEQQETLREDPTPEGMPF